MNINLNEVFIFNGYKFISKRRNCFCIADNCYFRSSNDCCNLNYNILKIKCGNCKTKKYRRIFKYYRIYD